MKTWGGMLLQLNTLLNSALDESEFQFHAAAALQFGREPPILIK